MRPLVLCEERLSRLFHVLDRCPGFPTVRSLMRTYGIYSWEVEQAAELGWVEIRHSKPRVGRPSRWVVKLSNPIAAKTPPRRRQIEPEIPWRYWRFAEYYTGIEDGRGYFGFRRRRAVEAYLMAFPKARSRAGASASASRLRRRRDVRAAILWWFARWNGELPEGEPFPRTASDVLNRLRELGSWRVRR